MAIKDILIITIIHVIIPLIGLMYFFSITRKMKTEKILNPPTIPLFVLFVSYGGLLVVTFNNIILALVWYGILGNFLSYFICTNSIRGYRI
jgi:hypothetical protein